MLEFLSREDKPPRRDQQRPLAKKYAPPITVEKGSQKVDRKGRSDKDCTWRSLFWGGGRFA